MQIDVMKAIHDALIAKRNMEENTLKTIGKPCAHSEFEIVEEFTHGLRFTNKAIEWLKKQEVEP